MRQGPEFEVVRKARAEQAVEAARAVLAMPRVRRVLGRYASELEEVAHMAVVPDVVGGRIRNIDSYRDRDVFPVVTSRVNEVLTWTMTTPMPRQRDSERRYIDDLASRGIESRQLYAPVIDSRGSHALDSGTGGETIDGRWVAYATSEGRELLRYCRPVVMLRYTGPEWQRMLTVIHEISHAHDNIMQPLSDMEADARRVMLESELKAYSIGYRVAQQVFGHEDFITLHQPTTAVYEQIRIRHNGKAWGKRAFDPKDEIAASLTDRGLFGDY